MTLMADAIFGSFSIFFVPVALGVQVDLFFRLFLVFRCAVRYSQSPAATGSRDQVF